MMKMDNSFKTIFASMMIVSGLVACDKPGPAESAGKKIDQVTQDVSSSVANSTEKADKAITKEGKEVSQAIDDTEITAVIKSNFIKEPGLQSLKMNVKTTNGVVTLSGTVDSQDHKDKAEKLSASVKGVKSVKNELKIK